MNMKTNETKQNQHDCERQPDRHEHTRWLNEVFVILMMIYFPLFDQHYLPPSDSLLFLSCVYRWYFMVGSVKVKVIETVRRCFQSVDGCAVMQRWASSQTELNITRVAQYSPVARPLQYSLCGADQQEVPYKFQKQLIAVDRHFTWVSVSSKHATC